MVQNKLDLHDFRQSFMQFTDTIILLKSLTNRVMGDGDEDTGGVGVNVGGELVSPDSGMTTIRSSRSSKESSVFLSDDSPVGEVIAGGGPATGLLLRNPSPLGLLSLSPPVPPERKKHRSSRNRSDIDLFNFDPLHSSDQSVPAGGELANSGEGLDEDERRAGSSSLSELEELSFLDFSAPNSVGGLESGNCSIDRRGSTHGNEMIDTVVPPTPVNSLVGSRPPSSCGVRFFPEDVVERISCLQHKDSVSSSLSETWDELGFDTQGALSSSDNNVWNRPKDSESPPNILEEVGGKDLVSIMREKESRQETLKSENSHHKGKSLEPQLSLITEQTESYDNWSSDRVLKDEWKAVTLSDLQLTPPEEDSTGKSKVGIIGAQEKTQLSTMKTIMNTLTPDTSKEEDEGKKRDQQMELLDFWTYSAQKGFLKSDSGTTTSYPESLDMWNMTIRDDSLSPLTTPDNLSENSGSFCGLNPNIKVESPLGYSDGGMEMWNTTIQEDSSSAVTTPEGPENGKDLSHMDSVDASETHANKQDEEENLLEEKSGMCEVVKIVIEAAESTTQSEETEDRDLQSAQSQKNAAENEDEISTYEGTDTWDLPVCSMVTSTSEYDNVGAGVWSLTSSPDTSTCPIADMIQLEEQSSPFIAVTKPIQTDERVNISNKEQPNNQVFLFEAAIEMGHRSREGSEETDWIVQPKELSPFLMVSCSTGTQLISQSPEEAAEPQMQTDQALSMSCVMTSEGELATESQVGAQNESNRNVGDKRTESTLPKSSPRGERDPLRNADSCHADSQDELGLEMEYIFVSGTVKEAAREWHDRPKPSERQSKGTKKSMATFSMLSYAASVLQTQAQAAKQDYDKDTLQNKVQQVRGSDQNQAVKSTPYQGTLDCAAKHHVVPEIVGPGQSKNDSEAFHQLDSGCSQSQFEEGNYDSEPSIVPRSVSPSLRYPSDHFLKTIEEVYVRSQISMEDSDEGGHSPPAPSPCPASLGDFQVWGAQLGRQDTPQTTSEPQSPVLTNSSASHTSSLIGTPVNETCVSIDKRLGLPFSGDLMEEENDDEEQDEETDALERASLPKWTSKVQREREEREELVSSDLLSFTDDLVGGSSCQQTHEPKRDGFLHSRVDYCDGRPMRTEDWDKWSAEHQTGDVGASQDSYLPNLR